MTVPMACISDKSSHPYPYPYPYLSPSLALSLSLFLSLSCMVSAICSCHSQWSVWRLPMVPKGELCTVSTSEFTPRNQSLMNCGSDLGCTSLFMHELRC